MSITPGFPDPTARETVRTWVTSQWKLAASRVSSQRKSTADPQGYAGLSDQVDNHWGQLFRSAMLSTLLSVGTESGTSNTENSLVQAIREGASNALSQVGSQVVGRSLGIPPTLTIRPGFPVRVIVTRDLVLKPYQG